MRDFSGFEWDDNKRQANAAKHGLDFADAVRVFEDPKQFSYRSPHRSERRFVSIGKVKGQLIAVVFTRRADKLRIISARAARKIERMQYDR
ncbi:MAG TPA: BrnT family toxin [Roseiarcus sp.]|nr:BrnT family toxin [Roseiarcus sp.]